MINPKIKKRSKRIKSPKNIEKNLKKRVFINKIKYRRKKNPNVKWNFTRIKRLRRFSLKTFI